METAACLCCNKISNYIMFTSTLNTDTQGVMGVTRGGQVSYHGDIIVVSFFYCDAITSSNILYGVTSGN